MKHFRIIRLVFLQICIPAIVFAQGKDTTVVLLQNNEKAYEVGHGKIFVYKKPRPFSFITKLPHDAAEAGKTIFKKESIKPLVLIAASTGLLLLIDEPAAGAVQKFSRNIHFHSNESNKTIWEIKTGNKPTTILKAPKNINTALYQVGQGFPGLILAAGLFTSGKITHNYRDLSTANQLVESFILMGLGTQIIKRITGRESPVATNDNSDEWSLLPSFKNFQKHTSQYDAYPSGHLATLMSSITILIENYPEKKWIKPVGYSLTGLVALAMINNNAHWASDYPLAIGLGYLCAKTVTKRNIRVMGKTVFKKGNNKLSLSFNYTMGRLQPTVIYKL